MLIDGLSVYPVESLSQAITFLNDHTLLSALRFRGLPFFEYALHSQFDDFADVKGQHGWGVHWRYPLLVHITYS